MQQKISLQYYSNKSLNKHHAATACVMCWQTAIQRPNFCMIFCIKGLLVWYILEWLFKNRTCIFCKKN